MLAEQPELRRLALALAEVGPIAEATTRAIIRVGGETAYTDAKSRAAVRTGYMRSTFFVEYDDDGLGFTLGATAPYTEYVEFGTSHMAPQPALIPAFDQSVRITEFAINTMLSRLL